MKKKISELRVAELRQELEKRGLDSKGLKGALVQRLQKAVEEEGSDPNEMEVVTADFTSPKSTSRRSVGRGKKSAGTESEETKDLIKQTVEVAETDLVTEEVQDDTPEGQSEDLGDHENGVNESNPDVSSDAQVEVAQLHDDDDNDDQTWPTEESPADGDTRDVTPTRDEEGDAGSAEPYYEDEYDQPAVEEEAEHYEDVAEYDDDHDHYEEEAGNDFQHEEDNPEYRVEEEMEEEEYADEQEGEVEEMMTVEEMAGHEESGAGDAVEEEYNEVDETDIASTEVQEEEEVATTEEKIEEDPQHESPPEDVPVETENVEPVDTGTASVEKSENDNKTESQGKTEQGGKEEVVPSEVDVLDMLDYDLELTGEQNNINTQQDDQSTKNNAGKTAKVDSTATNMEEASTSDDHKAHPKPVSSKPSSMESAKAGSQSSSKSAASTSAKDTGKASASGKRDTSTGSKEDNINRNLWISGLSSTTRASELKGAFSRYGKVVGAKVVTNVKSPGSKCFGYVTMATADAASKCILHLNNTEMHGRMITVEIAKGDPSASSKKSSTTSSRKEPETKDPSKSKDSDTSAAASLSRRQSMGQSKDGDPKDAQDSTKKTQEGKPGQALRRTGDDERPSGAKSPTRSRPERGSTSVSVRVGEKRHSNRSPAHSRSTSRNEPERKRPRPLDAADRKVVMDSNKGELRVNVSRTTGRPSGGARWEGDQKPKPLLSRRRSTSPIRRRSFSPLRSSRGGRGRGRGGLTRPSATYGDRTVTRPGPRRDGQVLTMSQIRAQNRDRGRIQDRGGRGGLSRGDLSADRERLRREREERERLRIERERLERERRQLEKDRQERERLEAERIRLEQERKRELERIEREKAEMRRLQEITRYEVEQRQRAIKRTYDDVGGHRNSRGAREGVPLKRTSDRGGGRPEVRRERDDNRRNYVSFNSRNTGQRNGPSNEPPPPGTTDYRSRQQGASRDSGNASKMSTYHDNRGRPQDRDESRYASENRSVEKYDRRSSGNTGGRSVDYHQNTNYDRTGSDTHRRGAPTRDSRDGRKVVRERPNDRGGSPPEYRRQSSARSNATARIELTREQSPPVRRLRRDVSPQAVSRNSNWRDGGKTARDTTRRGDDRDLREQLRGGRQDNYSESNRGQRRGSRSPNRNSSQYSGRWPDNSSSSQSYSASGDGNAIPTTGRSSGSANWNQQWAQNAWGGAAVQSASAVNRQVIPPYGTVPSQSAMITPGNNLVPTGQGYVTSGSDRQSRSFQGSSYNKQPIQRRF